MGGVGKGAGGVSGVGSGSHQDWVTSSSVFLALLLTQVEDIVSKDTNPIGLACACRRGPQMVSAEPTA